MPATRRLAAWCFAILLALSVLPMAAGLPNVQPALAKFTWMVGHQPPVGGDSWDHMIPLYVRASAGNGSTVYTDVFFDGQIKATYPPTSLLVFPLLEALGIGQAGWVKALFAISCACVLALALTVNGVVLAGLTRFTGLMPHGRPVERLVLLATSAIAVVTYYPLMESFYDGQVQLWISLLAALAVWSWLRGRTALAGVFVGLAATLKPHYALMVVWGLLRRQWGFMAALGGTCCAALATSIWQFGLACHLNYLDVWRFVMRHGESSHDFKNQSLSGMLHWVYGVENYTGLPFWWPPYHDGIRAASLAFAFAILLAALAIPARGRGASGPLDFGIMLLTVTLASPIAWRHHYGLALPLFAMCYTCLYAGRGFPRSHPVTLASAYLAMGTLWLSPMDFEGSSSGVLNANCFAAGLVLLALMYALRNRTTSHGPAVDGDRVA